MSLFIIAGKMLLSVFCLASIIVSCVLANPKSHHADSHWLAEYGTGFIMLMIGLGGFYYLWF